MDLRAINEGVESVALYALGPSVVVEQSDG
jgi:hypothetical protein